MGIKQKENATDLVIPECDLLAKIPLHGHVGKFLIFSIFTCSFCVFNKHILNSYYVLSDVLSFGGTMVNRPGKVMSPCLYSTGHLGVGKVGEGWKVGEAHGLIPFRNTFIPHHYIGSTTEAERILLASLSFTQNWCSINTH